MKKNKLQVLNGGYKENVWMHDSNFSKEDIEFINSAFEAAAKEIGPEFKKLIWKRTPKSKPELVRVK